MNIQELLEGVGGQSAPKFPSFSSSIYAPPCPSTSPNINLISTSIISTTPSSSTSTTSTLSPKGDRSNNSEKNKSNNPSQNNLKCPRCDSTHTKFCYYNNYNLTQPRHFCKTCRRYWTKGGTLRSVPIGGGCRKNKSSSGHSSSALVKAKANLSTEMLANGINQGFLQNELWGPPLQPGPSPTLWLPSSSHTQGQTTSHILSLLTGATHFPNPSPNPNPSHSPIPPVFTVLKTEGDPSIHGNGAPNFFGLGAPDVVQNGAGQSSNILELYQKWKLSSNYNNSGYSANENENENECGGVVGLGTGWMGLSTSTSSSSSSSPILKLNGSEALPLGGAGEGNLGGYRIWNSSSSSSWPEFPTVPINGTFP